LNDLPGINRKRQDEIVANEKFSKKLEQQLEVLQEECVAAKTQRDQAQAKLDAQQGKNDGEAMHPMLIQNLAPANDYVLTRSSRYTGEGLVQVDKTASLAEWIQAIPSPYD